MKIYLIGMPGSGKSTIGHLLAKEIGYEWIDLDQMIEKKALMFIDQIFEEYGEKSFRSFETDALKELSDKDNLVISTGGGVVVKRRNKKLMDGLTIYLDVDNLSITNRLKSDYDRPLLKSRSIEDLYDERFLRYQSFADLNVSNENSAEETVLEIVKYLKEKELI